MNIAVRALEIGHELAWGGWVFEGDSGAIGVVGVADGVEVLDFDVHDVLVVRRMVGDGR